MKRPIIQSWTKKNNDGNVTKPGRGYGFKKDKEITIKQGNDDSVSGSAKASTTNTITVKAEEGTEVEVTLDDVNIDSYNENKHEYDYNSKGEAAITIEADADAVVRLELDGDNVAKSGWGHAGVEKNGLNNGELIIQDDSGDSGSLEAIGGYKWETTGMNLGAGAGIGGAFDESTDNITITGGTIVAMTNQKSNGVGGAGIGAGGHYSSDSIPSCGDITITGGNVTAGGQGSCGAGIGSGYAGNVSGTIEITGGTVKAIGNDASGIGTASDTVGEMTGNVIITGGEVTAIGKSRNNVGIGSSGSKALQGDIVIGGDAVVYAYGSSQSNGYFGSGVGAAGDISQEAKIIVKDHAKLTAVSGGANAASIGVGASSVYKYGGSTKYNTHKNCGTIQILDEANVVLGVLDQNGYNASTGEYSYTPTGYIGTGKYDVDSSITESIDKNVADGSTASYEVDCTATINGQQVESTYRPDKSTSEWLWDKIGNYIHFTSGDISSEMGENGTGTYTNGSLTINCHGHQDSEQPIDQANSGVIRSDDPVAGQRWYWVTALLDADENVGYTYQQIGSNLIVNADEAAQAAVLHVLLSGWAEHTDVQSITFVTAGKTTTLYADKILTQTAGEHLTLTHAGEQAALEVDSMDCTALLGEAAA